MTAENGEVRLPREHKIIKICRNIIAQHHYSKLLLNIIAQHNCSTQLLNTTPFTLTDELIIYIFTCVHESLAT